ncbi:hypothetical protein D018_5159B, partial [Vibrio parahaemolyticus VP2007-007]
VHQVPVN